MPDIGDTAPEFTAPLANGDLTEFDLSEALGDGPLVLAFFPGAFTSVCTTELCTFSDRLDEFDAVDARVFGVSRDSPFTLNEFRDSHEIDVGLVSDFNGHIVEQYGIATDFDEFGMNDVAKRAVFVLDSEGTVTYRWVSDDPGVEPDYDEISEAAAETA
jgi:peroxiredoxin